MEEDSEASTSDLIQSFPFSPLFIPIISAAGVARSLPPILSRCNCERHSSQNELIPHSRWLNTARRLPPSFSAFPLFPSERTPLIDCYWRRRSQIAPYLWQQLSLKALVITLWDEGRNMICLPFGWRTFWGRISWWISDTCYCGFIVTPFHLADGTRQHCRNTSGFSDRYLCFVRFGVGHVLLKFLCHLSCFFLCSQIDSSVCWSFWANAFPSCIASSHPQMACFVSSKSRQLSIARDLISAAQTAELEFLSTPSTLTVQSMAQLRGHVFSLP